MTRIQLLLFYCLPISLFGADVGWPVNGGPYNIRYTELGQITPANVGKATGCVDLGRTRRF